MLLLVGFGSDGLVWDKLLSVVGAYGMGALWTPMLPSSQQANFVAAPKPPDVLPSSINEFVLLGLRQEANGI